MQSWGTMGNSGHLGGRVEILVGTLAIWGVLGELQCRNEGNSGDNCCCSTLSSLLLIYSFLPSSNCCCCCAPPPFQCMTCRTVGRAPAMTYPQNKVVVVLSRHPHPPKKNEAMPRVVLVVELELKQLTWIWGLPSTHALIQRMHDCVHVCTIHAYAYTRIHACTHARMHA